MVLWFENREETVQRQQLAAFNKMFKKDKPKNNNNNIKRKKGRQNPIKEINRRNIIKE